MRSRGRSRAARILSVVCLAGLAHGQSLSDRADEDELLRGWVELQLPEVMHAYVENHPTTDEAQLAIREAAELRMVIGDRHTTDDRREALLVQLGEHVAQMSRDFPEDPRRGVWLAQHATDVLLRQLPIDGSGLASLFGMPSDEELTRARSVAWQAHELSEEASSAIRDGLLSLERTPDNGRFESLRRRQFIGRLAHDERDHRIPFVRGMAAVLHAEFNAREPDERRGLYVLARDQLNPLTGTLQGRARVLVRIYLGLALARLGDYDAAEMTFRQAATDDAALEMDVFAARMGGVVNRERNQGLELALVGLMSVADQYQDDDALFYRMIIADRHFMLLRRQALSIPPARRADALAQAFDAYLDLLDDSAGSSERLRRAVDDRLARVAEIDLPPEQMPTPLLLATARQLGAAPETRDEATRLLGNVIERQGITARHRAEAMYELARLRMANEDRAGAADLFLRMARDLPDDPRAIEAVEVGVALALHISRNAPENEGARARARLGLELLLGKYGRIRGVDRWQYESAALAVEDNRLDEADAFLMQIDDRAGTWLDAQLLWVQVARRRVLTATDASERHARAGELLARIGKVTPLVQAVSRDEADGGPLTLLRIFEAEGALAQGDPDRTIELLDRVGNPAVLDESIFIIAMRTKVEAYRKADRTGEVVSDIRALRERSPEWATTITRGLLETLREEAVAVERDGSEREAAAFAEREMLGLAELLDHVTRGASRTVSDTMLIAETYRLGHRFDEALATYRMLPAERSDHLDVLVGRAECAFGLGGDHLGDAMMMYRRIAAMGSTAVGDAYWLAQLRMLQILDRKEHNTHKIVPRILQLRYDDPTLGTEQARKGLERLERKYRDSAQNNEG